MKRELSITLIKNPSLVPCGLAECTLFTEEREHGFKGASVKLIPQQKASHLRGGRAVADIGYMAISAMTRDSYFILSGEEVISYGIQREEKV